MSKFAVYRENMSIDILIDERISVHFEDQNIPAVNNLHNSLTNWFPPTQSEFLQR